MLNLPNRPELNYGDIWCLKCDKACDFDETGGHRLWSEYDEEGYGQGYLYLRAYCHDEHTDIVLTFQQARHMGRKRIEVFGEPEVENLRNSEGLSLTE